MVSLLFRGVGVLSKSLAGLSCSQAARCSNLPSALSTVQCMTARWFSKNSVYNFLAAPPKEPPKYPLSSFMRFYVQKRPLLVRQYPEASIIEVATLLGKEWRALSEAERQIYKDATRVDFLKFQEMYKQYKAGLNHLDLEVLKEKRRQVKQSKEKKRHKKEIKSSGRPKRSRNAFTIYLSENYNEIEGNNFAVKVRHLHHQWGIMPSSTKQVYLQLAEDDKVRYQNELKAWEEQMIEIGREDLLGEKRRKRILKETFVSAENKSGKKQKKSSKPAEGRTRDPKKHEE